MSRVIEKNGTEHLVVCDSCRKVIAYTRDDVRITSSGEYGDPSGGGLQWLKCPVIDCKSTIFIN